MKKIMLTSIVIGSIIFLSGCASNVPAAPDSVAKSSKQFKHQKNISNVYIYRDGFVGGANTFLITVDDKPAGRTGGGTYLHWKLKPGQHIIVAHGLESTEQLKLNIRAGENYYIHNSVGFGFMAGRPHLKVVSEEKAKKQIIGLKLGQSNL